MKANPNFPNSSSVEGALAVLSQAEALWSSQPEDLALNWMARLEILAHRQDLERTFEFASSVARRKVLGFSSHTLDVKFHSELITMAIAQFEVGSYLFKWSTQLSREEIMQEQSAGSASVVNFCSPPLLQIWLRFIGGFLYFNSYSLHSNQLRWLARCHLQMDDLDNARGVLLSAEHHEPNALASHYVRFLITLRDCSPDGE